MKKQDTLKLTCASGSCVSIACRKKLSWTVAKSVTNVHMCMHICEYVQLSFNLLDSSQKLLNK